MKETWYVHIRNNEWVVSSVKPRNISSSFSFSSFHQALAKARECQSAKTGGR